MTTNPPELPAEPGAVSRTPPRTTPTITDQDGRLVVTWPSGRAWTAVVPDVVEGWAEQVNQLRAEVAEQLVEIERHVTAYGKLTAENERLIALVNAANEYGDRHVIDLRVDGFTIAHPLSCRGAGLFACPIGEAAGGLEAPPMLGRYEVALNGGKLFIGGPA